MSAQKRLNVKHGLMLASKMEGIGANLPEPVYRAMYFWKKAPLVAPLTSHQRSMLPAMRKSRKQQSSLPSTLSDGAESIKQAQTASDMGKEQFAGMLNSNSSPD